MENLRQVAIRLLAASLPLIVPMVALSDPGAGRLEILTLDSTVFGNTRKIRVWLPYAADEPPADATRYPVLYLNDGQDLFDADESLYFSDEWMVDETLASLIGAAKIEPIIIVGIDNGGRDDRAREYLPYPDKYLSPPESDPQGSLYGSFLENDVFPLIESRYPVRTDKAGRTLGGSSYGALVALHVAAMRPALFGRLLLESPSFYVDDRHVLGDVERLGLDIDRIYLGAGTNEIGSEKCGDNDGYIEVFKDILDLTHVLTGQQFPVNGIRVNVEPCAGHSPVAWARRLPAAILFLYGE